MLPILGFSVLVQIACAVHCVRGGRNQMWLMVIIFLSLPGCFAYALFEILPDFAGRREVRLARAGVAKRLDPEKDLRRAREALEIADTSANRLALADRLAELERWAEALPEYRLGLEKAPGPDRGAMVRAARACFELGRAGEARELLDDLPETWYEELGARLPGAEAQCREAALLIKVGRKADALAPLEETERRLKRLDKAERLKDAEMYEWAKRTLAEIRTA